jgi:hypothetical protein
MHEVMTCHCEQGGGQHCPGLQAQRIRLKRQENSAAFENNRQPDPVCGPRLPQAKQGLVKACSPIVLMQYQITVFEVFRHASNQVFFDGIVHVLLQK